MRDPDIEMVEAKAGDMDDGRDPCGEPQPPSRVIPPEDGQEGSQELQNLPRAMNLSREQVRVEACRRDSGWCGCWRNGEIRQRTGMDPLLPGIPVDAFTS